jgi:hypothetical protein
MAGLVQGKRIIFKNAFCSVSKLLTYTRMVMHNVSVIFL